MITVDGDHTNLGAAQDLADVIPHVAIGGALIFDDVCHPKLLGLAEVWQRTVVDNRRFSSWTTEVIHDEGTVLGVQPAGQSDNEACAPEDARRIFADWKEKE